jgi:transketolase
MEDKALIKTVLSVAYKNKLSHLGSYFSSLNIIDEIYAKIAKDGNKDIFILSSGHAALALYAVIEKYYGVSAEYLFKKHGGHPHRDEENHLHCSTGSLGTGITVAVGRAVANPKRKVYCLISDGECAEGSIWESLAFIHSHNVKNIEVHCNVNGYSAYDAIDKEYLIARLKAFLPSIVIHETSVNAFSFLRGLNAHYHVMSEENYKKALEEV